MLTEEQKYWISQLACDLCYERVKFSALYRAYNNDEVDAKADQLKAEVSKLMEAWIVKEEDVIEVNSEREAELEVA